MSKLIDFTNPTWGHKIHGSTFADEKASGPVQAIQDWWDGAFRGSLLCHTSQRIEAGDKIRWQAGKSGGKAKFVTAEVYKVIWKRNPSDMYELYVRVIEKDLH